MGTNEISFQEKCRKFTNREIYVCQTMLVEKLLNEYIFQVEDIENYYIKVEDSDEEEPQEIYEWWVVSEWLAYKLKGLGEPILENDYGIWWGRTTTGQAIYMDSVIRKLVKELDIK